MKLVIAPNAFKGSLAADGVAEALKEGLQQGGFNGSIITCPVGDGGDGTGALLRQYLHAETYYYKVQDPLGRWIEAPLGWADNAKTAIIEMADACGLRLLKPAEYSPLTANTKGLGQLIKAALDKGAKDVLLCIGGSATVDGGSGLLNALGIAFTDAGGGLLHWLPADLQQLAGIDDSGIDRRLKQTRITVLCDVKNKLLGKDGAAAVFGPQKGADPEEVRLLDCALQQLDKIVMEHTGVKMHDLESGGAAGGVAAVLAAFGHATIADGIQYLLRLIGFEKILDEADYVITGEGSIDRQTLEGKAPYGVARMAKERNIPVIGVAGKVPEAPDELLKTYFRWLIPINQPHSSLEESMRDTAINLVETGKMIARKWLTSPETNEIIYKI